jgi:tRNA(fMet)-specific endonuclease VapC
MGQGQVTRYLLDTIIWIYVMRNRPPEVRERFSRLVPASVVMSPVVLGELHVGWRKSIRKQTNRSLLERFTQGATVEPIDAAVAAIYGELRTELEERGTPIGQNDLWIAAHARAADCVLVTHNISEFARVRGLRVEDWVNA